MRAVWQFHTSGQLIFGWEAVRQLSAVMLRRKFQRVFLVTDHVLAANGILDRVRGPLIDAGLDVDVFDGGEPEPSVDAALTTGAGSTISAGCHPWAGWRKQHGSGEGHGCCVFA